MLFIQDINIFYYKNMRYPQFAKEREKLEFLPIVLKPKEFYKCEPEYGKMLDCEVLLHTEDFWQYPDRLQSASRVFRQFNAEIFTEDSDKKDRNSDLISYIRLFRQDNGYKVMFCGNDSRNYPMKRYGHNEAFLDKSSPMCYTNMVYETAFVLKEGEYGRIVFNNRFIEHDTGKWRYVKSIYNFLNCDKGAYREKMFFRKKPDFEYSSLMPLI